VKRSASGFTYATAKTEGNIGLIMGLVKLTPQGAKALLEQGGTARKADLTKTMEAAGVKLVGYWFAEGSEWDVVGLFDYPESFDTAASALFSLRAMASGVWQEARTIRLASVESVDAAVAIPLTPLVDDVPIRS
jgi:uncharacterized protein with GYD domain